MIQGPESGKSARDSGGRDKSRSRVRAPAPGTQMLPAVEPSQRVARLVVWHVRPLSVARLMLLFSLCVVVIVLGVLTGTWLLLRRLGTLHTLAHQAGALGIHVVLHGSVVLRTAVLVGIGLALLATVLAWIASLLFNLAAGLTGGVELSVGERE